ncbi:MAG: alpha/beta hydrolase-fold protein [Vicinamibacterales bacterium]
MTAGRPARRALSAVALAATVLGVAGPTTAEPQVGRIVSAALGAVREYAVHLPAGYGQAPRRRYPVIYVLDGPPLDARTAEAAAANAVRGVSPDVIVVGIPNMRRGERARDFLPPVVHLTRRDGSAFTGGADRFLRFLRDELIPRVERDYRTAGPRMIAGHSLGAIFVCYSLTEAPSLFAARFAHSPALWRGESRLVQSLSAWLDGRTGGGGYLYLTVGANEGDSLQSGYRALRAVLQAHPSTPGLRWDARITPGAVHETNVALATPAALAAYFAAAPPP